MSCCDQLLDVFEFKGKPRSLLDARSTEIATKAGGWLSLRRCSACGQHWQIDADDPHEVRLAIKVDAPESWDRFDDKPARVQHLVNTSAGLDEGRCIWAGCERRNLKGVVYCPVHLYEMGARRFPARTREHVLGEPSS